MEAGLHQSIISGWWGSQLPHDEWTITFGGKSTLLQTVTCHLETDCSPFFHTDTVNTDSSYLLVRFCFCITVFLLFLHSYNVSPKARVEDFLFKCPCIIYYHCSDPSFCFYNVKKKQQRFGFVDKNRSWMTHYICVAFLKQRNIC